MRQHRFTHTRFRFRDRFGNLLYMLLDLAIAHVPKAEFTAVAQIDAATGMAARGGARCPLWLEPAQPALCRPVIYETC